jgi:hypothetical protein
LPRSLIGATLLPPFEALCVNYFKSKGVPGVSTLAQSTIHDATVTLGDVIAHLADFDADETIYAESPPPRSSRDRKLAQNAEATRAGENPACCRASARRHST